MNNWNDDKVFAGWDTPLEILRYAVVQSNYEGRTVPKSLADRVAALDDDADQMNFGAIDLLYKEIDALPIDPEFPYLQPNSLEEIRAERPEGPRQLG
ncbi:MAG: hypothetical protein VX349_07405, partial [Pseudomonadota bacterium]|nr:hypothetical protein [Pseudomonadota bacterium]